LQHQIGSATAPLPAIFNEILPITLMADLSPQPLPPKSIPFDAFVESTTQAVLRAVQAQSVRSGTGTPIRPPRIIIGIIAEPAAELSQSVEAE
jgi:hypothetical protein